MYMTILGALVFCTPVIGYTVCEWFLGNPGAGEPHSHLQTERLRLGGMVRQGTDPSSHIRLRQRSPALSCQACSRPPFPHVTARKLGMPAGAGAGPRPGTDCASPGCCSSEECPGVCRGITLPAPTGRVQITSSTNKAS